MNKYIIESFEEYLIKEKTRKAFDELNDMVDSNPDIYIQRNDINTIMSEEDKKIAMSMMCDIRRF